MRPNKLSHGHNLIWESSRMMLPEHRAALNSLHKQKEYVEKPELDEQEQLLIETRISLAYETGSPIKLRLYNSTGILSLAGEVLHIDRLMEKLRLQVADGRDESVSFPDIIGAEIDSSPEYL